MMLYGDKELRQELRMLNRIGWPTCIELVNFECDHGEDAELDGGSLCS